MPDVATLELRHLRLGYRTGGRDLVVVPDLSLAIGLGEAYGLVGESGCGKSTVALATMGYLGRAGRLLGGQILLEGLDLAKLRPEELRKLRGSRVAMVYQDPMSSLNPTMTVGRQLAEVIEVHRGTSMAQARAAARAMLVEVGLSDPDAMLERYSYQLSGGQQQRVVVGMALMAEPALLVMDEPTTGLDVTVEAAVLDLVADLRRRRNTSVLFISHNLGTIARVCDRIGVMYGGEIVEEGTLREVFRNPRHPYTRGLLACLPAADADKRSVRLQAIRGHVSPPWERPSGCFFAPRCSDAMASCRLGTIPLEPVALAHLTRCIRSRDLPPWCRVEAGRPALVSAVQPHEPILSARELSKTYARPGLFRTDRRVQALERVSLAAPRGATLAIVGESGSGKSTFAKVLTGLEGADSGELRFDGIELAQAPVNQRARQITRRLQMVFQNPDATLNPSHSVGFAIGRAVKRLKGLRGSAVKDAVGRLLDVVKMPRDHAAHLPRQLSGGQKQRVAIARALAGDPDLVIADEPVSALDVSVQAAIINLMLEIQSEREMTLVFISHDLAVVRYLADMVAVMYLGKVVEFGSAEQVFSPPCHPYTEALLSAAPDPDPDAARHRIVLEGPPPSTLDRPNGCVFATRCHRKLGPICDDEPPPEMTIGGHRIACHISAADLSRAAPVVTPAARGAITPERSPRRAQ